MSNRINLNLKQCTTFFWMKLTNPNLKSNGKLCSIELLTGKLVWHSSLEIPCSNKERQFQWKIIHNAIFTEHKLQLMNFSNGLCHFCRNETEDVRHLFALCSVSREVLELLQNKINSIIIRYFACNVTLEPHDMIIGYLHENKIVKTFVNFILHITKWELWKIRYENQRFTENEIADIIILKLSNATCFIEKTKAESNFKKVICMLKQFK